jgi:hypothetical protein
MYIQNPRCLNGVTNIGQNSLEVGAKMTIKT